MQGWEGQKQQNEITFPEYTFQKKLYVDIKTIKSRNIRKHPNKMGNYMKIDAAKEIEHMKMAYY